MIIDCTDIVNCLFEGVINYPLNLNKKFDINHSRREQYGLLLNDDVHDYNTPIIIDSLYKQQMYNILNN